MRSLKINVLRSVDRHVLYARKDFSDEERTIVRWKTNSVGTDIFSSAGKIELKALLAATFGSEIVLRDAVFEVLEDTVTVGIEAKLPLLRTTTIHLVTELRFQTN
jgi:hypothetical protein